MKILICSDIHANIEALRMLTPFLDRVDRKICLGDIVGYGCAVNECINYMRKNEFLCIQGNHERYLIEGVTKQTKFLNESVVFGIDIAKRDISKDNLKWINSLPISIGLNIANKRLLFVHGSPFDPTDEYIYPNTFDEERFKDLKYDYIAIGHTHREFISINGHQTIVNPGSVGQARDHEGNACFIILDLTDSSIVRYRIPYDFSSHLDLSKKMGGAEWIYKHYKNIK